MSFFVSGVILVAGAAVGLVMHGALMRAFDPEGREANRRRMLRRAAQEKRAEERGRAVRDIGEAALRVMPLARDRQRSLNESLRRAGLNASAGSFWAVTLVSAAVGLLGGIVLSLALSERGLAVQLGVAACVTMAGVLAPRLVLFSGMKRRREAIEASLPGVLELLAVVVGAGQTVEQGIKTVSEKAQGPLAEELSQAYADIAYFGCSTEEALAKMAQRCAVPAVSSFSASVSQSLAAGSSISQILKSQAKIATDNYYLKVEERSNKIRVKMIVPTVLFILPPVFLITLGPSVMKMIEALPQITSL